MWTPRGHTEKERVGFSFEMLSCRASNRDQMAGRTVVPKPQLILCVFKAGGSYMTETELTCGSTDYILNTISMLIEADTPKNE